MSPAPSTAGSKICTVGIAFINHKKKYLAKNEGSPVVRVLLLAETLLPQNELVQGVVGRDFVTILEQKKG